MKTAKINYLVFFLFLINPLNNFAQNTLTIEITGLRNNNGQVLLQLMDEKQNSVKDITGIIENNTSIIVLEHLKAKKYAFRYFHDENKNRKMDINWIGIPTEGFGFSNNAKGKFGPPSFEKWIFELNDRKKMICNPTYYL